MNQWLLLFIYSICSTMGLLLIKSGLNTSMLEEGSLWQGGTLIRLLTDGSFIAGFIFYVSGFLIWLYILSRNDLSVAFPVASGVLYLGLLAGSFFWLQEGIGIIRIVGVFLILAGIILVSQS